MGISEYLASMGSRISYNEGARKMIPPKRKKNYINKEYKKIFHLLKVDILPVPSKHAAVNNQRNKRSNTIEMNFQSSIT